MIIRQIRAKETFVVHSVCFFQLHLPSFKVPLNPEMINMMKKQVTELNGPTIFVCLQIVSFSWHSMDKGIIFIILFGLIHCDILLQK